MSFLGYAYIILVEMSKVRQNIKVRIYDFHDFIMA